MMPISPNGKWFVNLGSPLKDLEKIEIMKFLRDNIDVFA